MRCIHLVVLVLIGCSCEQPIGTLMEKRQSIVQASAFEYQLLDLVRQWCLKDEMHKICAAECVFDSDCDDGIWCNGQEWCCTWENSTRCKEKYICHKGESQCGPKMWAPLAICDEDTDTCRGCYTAEECDDGYFCTGRERCSTMYPWQGVCLRADELPPCIGENELCDEENDRCYFAITECEYDYQCGSEEWCDQTGKCQKL